MCAAERADVDLPKQNIESAPKFAVAAVAASPKGGKDQETVQRTRGASPTASAHQATKDKSTPRRMWFLRMPKPPESTALKALELEVQTYQAQMQLLNESITVKKLERDAVRENVRTARQIMRRCREAFDYKLTEIKPLRDALRSGNEASKKLQGEAAELDARTEAELDAKLRALSERIEHESIPLAEEKKLVVQIKRLEGQRTRIQELEASFGAFSETKADIQRLRSQLAGHDLEMDVLKQEKDTQEAILKKYVKQESEVAEEVEAMLAERRRIKDLNDAAYSRFMEQRRMVRETNSAFHGNRKFSQRVRQLVASGQAQGAQDLCGAQVEEEINKLATDEAHRRRYLELWELQRTTPADDEFDSEKAPTSPTNASANTGKSYIKKLAPKIVETSPPMEISPSVKAQKVVSAALLAVTTPAVAAAALETKKLSEHSPCENLKEDGNGHMPLQAANSPARPKKDLALTSPELKHTVPLIVIEQVDTFEIPEVIRHLHGSSSDADDAQNKEEMRERNRQLQMEAEARKAKRLAERERRRKKAAAAVQIKMRESAEVGAPSPTAVISGADNDSGLDSVSLAGTELTGAQGGIEIAELDAEATATAKGEAAAIRTLSGIGQEKVPAKAVAAATKAPLKVVKAMEAVPAAKRPVEKHRPLIRQLKTMYKEHQVLVFGAFFLFLAVFFGYLYGTSPAGPVRRRINRV